MSKKKTIEGKVSVVSKAPVKAKGNILICPDELLLKIKHHLAWIRKIEREVSNGEEVSIAFATSDQGALKEYNDEVNAHGPITEDDVRAFLDKNRTTKKQSK